MGTFSRLLVALAPLIALVLLAPESRAANHWQGSAAASASAQPKQANDIALLVELDSLMEQIKSDSVRAAVRRQIDQAMEMPDRAARARELARILAEVKKAGFKSVGPPAALADPAREIEVLNLVTEYLYLLRDLNGSGFLVVKRNLTDNIITTGVPEETKRICRRLLEACNEAEAALRDIKNINEDWAERVGGEFGSAIGFGSVAAVVLGDPTPLVVGLGRATKNTVDGTQEANRAIDIVRTRFGERISTIAFEANSRRGDLISAGTADASRFLSIEVYDKFRAAMESMKDSPKASILNLQGAVTACPSFHEARVQLAGLLIKADDPKSAAEVLRPTVVSKSLVLQREGLRARAYRLLAEAARMQNDSAGALDAANEAITLDPQSPDAFVQRSLAHSGQSKHEEALRDADRAAELGAMESNGYYHALAAMLAADAGCTTDDVLDRAHLALLKGYPVYRERKPHAASLQAALSTPRGKYLTEPKLMAYYVAGVLNDDIVVINVGTFTLTNVTVSGEVTFVPEAGSPPKTIILPQRAERFLSPGQTIAYVNVLSMPEASKCSTKLSFSCDEWPQSLERSFYYNHNHGKAANLTEAILLNSLAWEVHISGTQDRAMIDEALSRAKRACELTHYQDPAMLDTLAHIYCAQGDQRLAIEYQERAIALIDEAERVFGRPFDRRTVYDAALSRFRAGRCR